MASPDLFAPHDPHAPPPRAAISPRRLVAATGGGAPVDAAVAPPLG